MGRWRTGVLIGIHLIFAVHMAHWWSSGGKTLAPLEPSESMAYAAQGVVNVGLILFVTATLSTLLLGRWFCGWGCHVIALQDACRWLLLQLGIRPRPLRSRVLLWVPLLAALYMFALPAVERVMAGGGLGVTAVHLQTDAFWRTFPTWPVALLTFLVCGGLAVFLLGSKGFCTYGCPYGAVFGVADLLAPGRIRVTDACKHCGHCTSVCTSNVLVHAEVRDHGMVVDPGCMKCMDCVSSCPSNALYFGFGRPAVVKERTEQAKDSHRKPAFSWGEEALLALGFALAFLAFDGLYDQLPLLFALGWGGCLAFGLVLGLRALRWESVKLLRWHLKRRGRVTAVGIGYGVTCLLLGALWLHSGFVTWSAWRCRVVHDATGSIHRSPHPWRAQLAQPASLTSEQAAQVAEGLRHGEAVRRWGLVGWPTNDLRLAWLHLLAGDDAAVEARISAALARMPENTRARVDYAAFLVARDRGEDALAPLKEAVVLAPRDPDVLHALARIQVLTGDPDAASATYDRLLEVVPDRWQLQFEAGVLEKELGRPSRVAIRMGEVVRLYPEHTVAREALADALLLLGRPEEAVPHCQVLLKRDPGDPGAHRLLGVAYMSLKRFKEAERHLRRALLVTRDPRTLEALVELLEGQGRQSEADALRQGGR